MIPTDTPYKVIKYLVKLSNEKVLPKNYVSDKFMIHLVDREIIVEPNGSQNKFLLLGTPHSAL